MHLRTFQLFLCSALLAGVVAACSESDKVPGTSATATVPPASATIGGPALIPSPVPTELPPTVEPTTAAPSPPAEPTPSVTPDPPEALSEVDRTDCDEIRGTDYRSPTERDWFLDSCVTPGPASEPAAPASPFAPSQGAPGSAPTVATAGVGLQIISLTSPVAPGQKATLNAQASPNTTCIVLYAEALQVATGPLAQLTGAVPGSLVEKQGVASVSTDGSGTLSWSWRVEGNSEPGEASVSVLCDEASASATFAISK